MSGDPCAGVDPCCIVGYPRTPATVNPITGLGTPTQVAFFNTPTSIASDPDLYWDNTSKLLSVGAGVAPLARVHIRSPTDNAPVHFWIDNADAAPSDFFAVANGSGAGGVFSPTFFGSCATSNQTGLFFVGSGLDDVGDLIPVTIFDSRAITSVPITGFQLVNRDPFSWGSAGSIEYMRISKAGYLGVGNAFPTATVDSVNGGFVDPALRASGGIIGFANGPVAVFGDFFGTAIMGVSVTGLAGRVGIGSVALAPTKTLDVGGDARVTGKLTVVGAIDPTMVLLSGADKRFGATDAGAVYLAPFADAVTAIQIRRADNATVLVNHDTSNQRVQVGASAAFGTEKMRVVANSDANGIRLELASTGVASPLGYVATGTYTGTGQFLGFFANPTLTQTGGTFHGSTVRSLATFTLSATAATGQYYTFHDNNTLSFAAPAAMAAYASFRANATKTGTGAIAAYIGFLAQPGGGGAGTALYYGVFTDAYATPTIGVGGHFQGVTAALEVGAGAVGAAAVTGRWFDSGKMVVGAAALDATEFLKVAGEVLTTTDRGYTATGQTSSAGAAAGTLLNSPAAGNPTFWLKVKINGGTFAVPCWAG